MKTKTRNTIGKFLVWGGIIGLGASTYNMWTVISNMMNSGGTSLAISVVKNYADTLMYSIYMNIAFIIALLIGGLWGMKK